LVVSTLTLSTEPPKIVLDKTVAEVGRVKKGEKVKVEFHFTSLNYMHQRLRQFGGDTSGR